MLDRRTFLRTTGAGLIASLAATRTVFAALPGDNRLVCIVLRGGLDGLHALAPYADADYRKLRPTLAIADPKAGEAHDLDGYFALHPALGPLAELYAAGELVLVPAAATRYRNRSHFDGQNMLENGSGRPFGAKDGWLNRAILAMNEGDRRLGLALGPSVPLILRGAGEVQSWGETQLPEVGEDFLQRLGQVYAHDARFMDALHDATGALKPDMSDYVVGDLPRQRKNIQRAAHAAADLLSQEEGPRVAVMELQGWDTHISQNQRLASLLPQISDSVMTLKAGLGPVWDRTTVMVVSEFGRTAKENGSRGTDHGTGGIAILAGGALRGGRIAGEWPGLTGRALYEERDVRAVNEYEGIFKALLIGHLGLDQAVVEDRIFPKSVALRPMDGLLRA